MPIEAKFKSKDRPTIYSAGAVYDGGLNFWTDLSGEMKSILAVHCMPGDMGGIVYRVVDPEKIVLVDALKKINKKLANDEQLSEDELAELEGKEFKLSVDEVEEIIAPGFRYEKDIIDFEGEAGRLILRHVMPNGQINSLN